MLNESISRWAANSVSSGKRPSRTSKTAISKQPTIKTVLAFRPSGFCERDVLYRRCPPLSEVSSVVGTCYETVRRWTEWYRSGGLEEVLSRRHGGSGGREPKLSEEEEQALIEKAREGELRTIWDGVEWARSEADVEYSYWGMRHVFDRLGLKKKVPRQQSPDADPEKQEAWKKGD